MALHIDQDTGLITIGCSNAGATKKCVPECRMVVRATRHDGQPLTPMHYELATARGVAEAKWATVILPGVAELYFCTARCLEHYMSRHLMPDIRAILIAQDQTDAEEDRAAVMEAQRIVNEGNAA